MRSKLFCELERINREINQQIPVTINRQLFESQGTDEEDRHHYLRHRAYQETRRVEYLTYQYMNECYPGWKDDEQRYKQHILKKAWGLCTTTERTVYHAIQTDIQDALKRYFDTLSTTLDDLIAKQKKGVALELEDKELAWIFKKQDELTEYRDIIYSECERNELMATLDTHQDQEQNQLIQKTNLMLVGVYFDKIKTDVAQCGEYSSLALVRMLKAGIFDYDGDDVIESVCINSGYDNHVFLIVNRDRNKPIQRIKDWGDKAIVVDCWANFVGHVDDVLANPKIHHYYPEHHDWRISGVFTQKDKNLLNHLTTLHQYFAITNIADMKARAPLLMEEYQLTDLENSQFAYTHGYLNALIQRLTPNTFRIPVKVMLINSGNEMVTVIDGFTCPVIAIHVDFFCKITPNGPHTIAMLEFGLAQALECIKQSGMGGYSLRADQQHSVDKAAVEKCLYGEAAIEYLQASIDFAALRTKRLKIPSFKDDLEGKTSSFEQRIKNLRTVFAQKSHLTGSVFSEELPCEVIKEFDTIKPTLLFFSQFTEHKDTVSKLNYLTTQLNELHKELLPYEFTQQLSARGREFCSHLYSLHVDFANEKQEAAANELIETAYNLRIPAFERLYFAINHVQFDENHRYRGLKPLGIFKRLQKAIQLFTSTKEAKGATGYALAIMELFEQCKNHFAKGWLGTIANAHLATYRQLHDQRLPLGNERFFGSHVGLCIGWQTFPAFKGVTTIPWNHMLPWIAQDHTGSICKALFLLGVDNDKRMWVNLKPNQLYEMAENVTRYFSHSIGQLQNYPEDYVLVDDHGRTIAIYQQIAHYLGLTHRTDNSMFDNTSDFEQAFALFYDRNRPALNIPLKRFNHDNPTVHYMLQKFSEVAIRGSDADKMVVKSFFLGREDKRDFKGLCNAFNGMFFGQMVILLDYDSPYIQFVFNQYKPPLFTLFSSEEIITFIDNNPFNRLSIPFTHICKLCHVPSTELTFASLLSIISLLKNTTLAFILKTLWIKFLDNNSYPLLSNEASRLLVEIQALKESGEEFLKRLTWQVPESPDEVLLNAHELIHLYRTIDGCLSFPSEAEHHKLNQLLKHKILALTNLDERIEAWEELLVINDKHKTPLSHIAYCNEIIELWVIDVAQKYGKDDSSQEYHDRFIQVIQRISAKASKRDLTSIFAKVADAIESQSKVSEAMGIIIEPEKYFNLRRYGHETQAISALASASKLFNARQIDQLALLNFLSTPISSKTVNEFSDYLIQHNIAQQLVKITRHDSSDNDHLAPKDYPTKLDAAIRTLYHSFWNRDLRERAVIIDHVLIPATTVISDKEIKKAYDFAFDYIAQKLFPEANQAGTDDEFAKNFVHTYLEQADKYTREFLLAGLLVTSNQSEQSSNKISAGKKLSMLCSNMGPAYVKLAQAIHSHPNTPEHIRKDLEHLKGRANPPPRWQLWRMIREVLPDNKRQEITHVGKLLGSASYNLALHVQTNDGKECVLSLLRENAEEEAKKGFTHIKNTIMAASHPRIQAIRPAAVSIIEEAQALSQIEMDYQMSKQQYTQAVELYHNRAMTVGGYVINVFPAKLIHSGPGYRFIDLMQGKEFNELPSEQLDDKAAKKAIAQAVLFLELSNILSGDGFDSDRHGSQIRAIINKNTIQLGLYDFGEMGVPPSEDDLQQLSDVLHSIPKMPLFNASIDNLFDRALSTKIDELVEKKKSAHYLIRVRKALLALQDFQRILTPQELIEVLIRVQKTSAIHPKLQDSFLECINYIGFGNVLYSSATALYGFFNPVPQLNQPHSGHKDFIIGSK